MSEHTTPPKSSELDVVKAQLEVLSLKLDKISLGPTNAGSKKKAWWTTAVEILGIPALVVAILFQVSQTTSTLGVPEKTRAETEKLKTEELKTRAELTALLDALADKKAQGVEEYRAEIEQTLPKLEATLQRLSELEATSNRWAIERLFAVYVALWIIYVAVSLFFEIVHHIWAAALNSVSNAVYGMQEYDDSGKAVSVKRRRRIQRLRKLLPWFQSFMGPVPGIVEWAIRLSIFVALLIPFFDHISAFLGSSEGFDSIMASARQGDVAGSIAKLKALLFSGGF